MKLAPALQAARGDANGGFLMKKLAGVDVLLVEDNVDSARLGRIVLNRDGANVTVVASGKDAIEALTRQKFDVVLMDWVLPDTDGCSVTRQLRRDGYKGKIIMVSGHAMPEHLEAAHVSGTDGYIIKPFSPARLTTHIWSLISGCLDSD